jgi:hypothetical protein
MTMETQHPRITRIITARLVIALIPMINRLPSRLLIILVTNIPQVAHEKIKP